MLLSTLTNKKINIRLLLWQYECRRIRCHDGNNNRGSERRAFILATRTLSDIDRSYLGARNIMQRILINNVHQ
jgi:hypothetical protein